MPYSYSFYKSEIKSHLLRVLSTEAKILDVGPGCGTYGSLLKPEFKNIEAIEIWEKYVHQFNLRNIYNTVHIGNIIDFDFSNYDYLIMGDVLEHIELTDAQTLIKKICDSNKKCLVAVPYMYTQGSYEGNVYETHLQPDLNPKNFTERYPELSCLAKTEDYGYYINY